MRQFEEAAVKFTLDGGLSAYEFKDEAEEKDEGLPDGLKVGGASGSCLVFLCGGGGPCAASARHRLYLHVPYGIVRLRYLTSAAGHHDTPYITPVA